MSEWYYLVNGEQSGPVTAAQLKSLAASGGLGPDDLVWNPSMTEWAAAKRVRGLKFPGAAPAPQAVATGSSSPAARAPGASGTRATTSRPAAQPEAPPEPAPLDDIASAFSAPADPFAAESYAPAESAESYAPVGSSPAPLPALSPSQPATLGYSSPLMGGEGAVTGRVLEALRATSPWVRLISILMFIGCGIILLAAAGMMVAAIAGGAQAGAAGPFVGVVGIIIAILYLAMGALYFFPALMLSRYASRIGRLMVSRRSVDLEEALEAQKSFWFFAGIMCLIAIGLSLLVFALPILMHR